MFGLFARTPQPASATLALYGALVAAARAPGFYAGMGVADSVDGRFDMLALHLWLVLRRLNALGRKDEAQALFDHVARDLDRTLREMGVGDLSVGKHVRRMGRALYGRFEAYDAALAAGDLAPALARNVWRGQPAGQGPALLAAHVATSIAALEGWQGPGAELPFTAPTLGVTP